MRTTWTDWKPDDMQDAAESEARTGFDALDAPKRHFLAPLPYYGAYAEYENHVAMCAECQSSITAECPEGAVLFSTARVGLDEQRRLAASN